MAGHSVAAMLRVPRRALTAVVAAGVLLSACGWSAPVVTERADQTVDSTDPGSGVPGEVLRPETGELAWSSCADFGIPDARQLGTNGWECSTLDVSMDPFAETSVLEPVVLALTRHLATGNRQGTLVVNPGGPGGSGLEVVWGLRSGFPAEVLRSFDIVSWDPRGVGRSTPPISCGSDPDLGDDFLMEVCARDTGELAAYLSAPYSAEDLEAIRAALGETQLDYLGYSYGTAIGAQYATRYPDTVGRFVLDGATDPRAGAPDGVFEDGFPYYSRDGRPDAARRFEVLCDASARCDLGPDSREFLVGLRGSVDELPTDDVDFGPGVVTADLFGDLMASAFAFSGDWELLATGLADARNGDASALASLAAFDPGIGTEATGAPPASFELANLVIYCADFGPSITEWTYCDPIPRNEVPLRPVVAVDVATPIVVIGTTYDPLTPGSNAPDFADALGDAVHVIWDGVGHTAFPSPTACIDDLVVDYLMNSVVPAEGSVCAFLAGLDDDAAIADVLFGHGDLESLRLLRNAVESGRGVNGSTASCVAAALNELDDQIISHVVLGVTSDQAEVALAAALAGC